MGLDFINPKYLQKNSDTPSFLKPKQKYQTQEAIDKVQPVIDISKLAVHAATPSDNAKQIELSKPIDNSPLPKINTPEIKKTDAPNEVFGQKSWDYFKQTHQETPDVLKPLGYALETFNRIPFLNRVIDKAGETFAGKGSIPEEAPAKIYSQDSGKVGNIVADIAGSGIGMFANPEGNRAVNEVGNLAEKGITKLLPNIGKYGTAAARGAAEMGSLNGLQSGAEGDSLADTGKAVLEGALTGAGFGIGSKALGELIKLPGIVKDAKTSGINQAVESKLGNIDNFEIGKKGKITKIEPKPISVEPKPIDNLTPSAPVNEVAFTNTDLLKTKTDPVKLSTVTQETTQLGGSKNRQFTENSVLNSQAAPSELKDFIQKNMPTYEPITNQKTWDKALNKVETDYKKSVDDFLTKTEVKSADDTALGQALIVNAIKKGDINEANRISVNLAEKLTQAGQTVQAAAIFKRLTPEGMLQYANNTVNKVNQQLEKEFGKAAKKVQLTDEEAKTILDRMTEIQKMPEGSDKDIELARVMNVISNKIPSTFVDKIRSFRNIALLGNTKTFVRNIAGNGIMGAADNLSNFIGGTLLKPLDIALSKKTGMQTIGLPSLKTQAQGFVKGGKEAISNSLGGLKLSDLQGKTAKEQADLILNGFANPINRELVSNGKFETGKTLAFKSKPMRILENAVNTSLALGDKPFSQAYYDDVINQLKKANKTDIVTNEMKDIAEKIASERTYQDMNTISTLATALKRLPQNLQNHPKLQKTLQVFTDSLIPYVKTPASILKRGIEFTPGGIIEGLLKLGTSIKNDTITAETQREIIDRISRGLVGSGLVAGGAALANKGLITGAANKDKDVANLEQQTGKQPYSLKIGDKYISYNQYQPVSMPIGAAAQGVANKKNGQDTFSALSDSVANALNFYADQPMLQSIQNFLGSANDSKGIGQRIINAGLELPKQFIPTTLKQIAQVKDDTQRNSYSPNYLENQLVNPIKSKIPGQSTTLQPKVDTLGNEIKQFQGNNSLFNVFLNPGYTTKENTNSAQQTLLDVFKETGDKTIFPRVADKTISYKGKQMDLSSKEYADFQKYIGSEANYRITDLSHTKSFINASPQDKAKALQKVVNQVYDEGKNKILKEKGSIK